MQTTMSLLMLCMHVHFLVIQLNILLGLFDQEVVPLRKICRRPETDYRLQGTGASSSSSGYKARLDPVKASASRVIS